MATEVSTSNSNNYEDSYLGLFLNDACVVTTISVFLILYAGIIAPRLPNCVLKWFNNWIVQIALFFAIVYISTKNVTIALITTIAVLVTLMVANNRTMLKKISKPENVEKFSTTCKCILQNDGNEYVDENEYDDENEYYDKNEYNDENEDNENNKKEKEYEYNKQNIKKSKPTMMARINNVVGIMEEHIEENDSVMSGIHNVITKGKMLLAPVTNTVSQIKNDMNMPVVGVEERTIDSESVGSFLNENVPMLMTEENASAEHNDIMKTGPTNAEDAIKEFVTEVTNQVEQENNMSISDEMQEQVMNEVSYIIAQMVKQKPVGEFDVVNVCREIYRKRL